MFGYERLSKSSVDDNILCVSVFVIQASYIFVLFPCI